MGRITKRGTKGNAVQYVTRNQALKKLQLRLSEFRRLCIVKGIFPREPKKKVHGQNKTYYHIKDVNFLAHESLLNTFREIHAWDKKIRKAQAKGNEERAEALHRRRPKYKLDHLVKERYPTFVDALRDLDDPVTLTHLFATLPAEDKYRIPRSSVERARQLALEWQAWIVRTHALRKCFVSVKGYYFQAEVLGQTVTWLVPHQLSQVLPHDVDYRVMLTFLEFYMTMMQFVHIKLYTDLGLAYPPKLNPELDDEAEDLAAIMSDLAKAAGAPVAELTAANDTDAEVREEVTEEVKARLNTLGAKLKEIKHDIEDAAGEEADEGEEAAEDSEGEEEDEEEDDEAPEINSGAESESEEEEAEGSDDEEQQGEDDEEQQPTSAAAALLPVDDDDESPADAATRAAGGTVAVDADDDSALCASLFNGLVCFLGREVPREPLMLVIRAFGGEVGWDGAGSAYEANDDAITHHVVDRPVQGHRFLSREYVQPQWVFDSANFRVLAEPGKYAPGAELPPHLSPFVDEGEAGYTPEYELEMKKLQALADAARRRARGETIDDSKFLEDDAAGGGANMDKEEAKEKAERTFQKELRAELKAAKGETIDDDDDDDAAADAAAAERKRKREEEGVELDDDAMKSIMMSRKTRKLYAAMKRGNAAKAERVEELKAKAKAAKQALSDKRKRIPVGKK